MTYRLQLTLRSSKDLAKLPVSTARRIIKKLKEIRDASDPMRFAKPLSNQLKGLYRFRIGDYRVLFQKNQKGEIFVLMILRIGHRRDVYES